MFWCGILYHGLRYNYSYIISLAFKKKINIKNPIYDRCRKSIFDRNYLNLN